MQVFQNGEEVKDAKVTYSTGGAPVNVVVKGVTYDVAAFELKDETTKKQTKPADTNNKSVGAMTTKDLKSK